MKKISCLLFIVFIFSACSSGATPSETLPNITEEIAVASVTFTPIPSETPTPTETPTITPTFTPEPTETPTPTITPTSIAGGSGYLQMMVDMNILRFPIEESSEFETIVSFSDFIIELGISEISSRRNSSLSPDGNIAAFWNCDYKYCDTVRGKLYVFATDFDKIASIEVPGAPSFLGWSANQDRLLYYLSSSMADDFYLVKTQGDDFGEVIDMGRMTSMSWAPDRETLYMQKGDKVTHIDKDGAEIEQWTCNFNNACMLSPSPDGNRFAGIQKFVPTYQGNPVITISNQDFSDKQTVFISDDKALILGIDWLPDNQHIVVYGMTARQRIRRFWRLDYLSVINLDSGEERVIELEIPEDSEYFGPCGLTPDSTHLVYLDVGGRVKEAGRIFMSGRYAVLIPLDSDAPEIIRITDFEESWESCPVWLLNRPAE